MWYVVLDACTIVGSYVDFTAAKQYVMLQKLSAWASANDFFTRPYHAWWVVNLPVGFVARDNCYCVTYDDIVACEELEWFPEHKAKYQEYRLQLMTWMRQVGMLKN